MIRLQKNPENVLDGVIFQDDNFDFTICNPPFFNSLEERIIRKSSVNIHFIIYCKDLLNF